MGRRVRRFGDFIGQKRVIQLEQNWVEGAIRLGKAVPHQLFIGGPGRGKTSLAEAVAKERGTKPRKLIAGRDTTPEKLCDLLKQLRECDVLFIDEAHALRRGTQEILLSALEQQQIPRRTAKGLDRTEVDNLPQEFTAIIATTDPGQIARALRSRFEPVSFDAYSLEELKEIAKRVASVMHFEVTGHAARRIAETAQGSPRFVDRRIEQLHKRFPEITKFTETHVESLLTSLGVDANALTIDQRKMLRVLQEQKSGVVALEAIAIRLGVDVAYVRQDLEQHLLERSFVTITRGGRCITQQGRDVLIEGSAMMGEAHE